MKKEIDNNLVNALKLKNPFYRLDYLKEYFFRYRVKDTNEISGMAYVDLAEYNK